MAKSPASKHFDRFLFQDFLPQVTQDPHLNITRKMWAIGLLSIIVYELAHGRPVRKAYLARDLDCSPSTLVNHLNYLEDIGIITQTRIPAQPPIGTQVAIELADKSMLKRIQRRLDL